MTANAHPGPGPAFTPTRLVTKANTVAIARAVLAFVVVGMLYAGRHLYLGAFVLTLIAIWMDAVDGWVARRYGEDSRLGAVIDILTDRIVEMTYWIAFERGLTAFGSTSMQKSAIGRLLVSSRASRAAYGAAKVGAFSLMILAFAPQLSSTMSSVTFVAAVVCVYATVVLCVIRGLPVLLEGRRLI